MEIRIREDGSVVTDDQFRAMYPNTSFGPLDEETLDAFGADPVFQSPQSTHTRYQYAQRDGVEEIDGQWFTKWIVVDMTQEQKDAVDAQAKAANAAQAKAELDAAESAAFRAQATAWRSLAGASASPPTTGSSRLKPR